VDDFINQLVGLVPAFLRSPARWIADRILAIWHTSTGFWTRVRAGWTQLRALAWTSALAQIRHLVALATTLRWFATVLVPRWANIALDAARSEFHQLVAEARNLASAALAEARRDLAAIITDVSHLLSDWATWTLARINELRTNVSRLIGHVFGVLATPDRLVGWIVDPMAHALIRWAEDNAVRFGRVLVAQRTRIFLSSLQWAEDIVSRIL